MARYMTAPLDLTIEELNIYQLIYKKADFNSWVSDYTLDQLSTDSHPGLCISRKVASRIVNKLVSLGYLEVIRVGVKGKPSVYKINKESIYNDSERNEYSMNRERIGTESVMNDEPVAMVSSEQRNESGLNRERIGTESVHPIIKSKTKSKKEVYITCQHLSMDKTEYEKLCELYGKEMTDSKIEYADNYAKLKNYSSLYKTMNNWLKADKSKQPQPEYINPNDMGELLRRMK